MLSRGSDSDCRLLLPAAIACCILLLVTGGECASLNLEQLYGKFRPGVTPPKELGRTRDWCIDLCPKFLMACGNLVKVLLHTKVTKYLEF